MSVIKLDESPFPVVRTLAEVSFVLLQFTRLREKDLINKGKIRAIMPFKVIQGHRGRYQSNARMSSPAGSGAEPRPPAHFGIGLFEVHRTLQVERTVLLS